MQRIHEDFRSELLENSRRITVHLPPGYNSDPARRYPVLYLHDGQNIFDASRAAFGVSWQAGEIADRLIEAGRIKPVILVGIDNTAERLDEYGADRDRGHEAGGKGELYARFVFEELKPYIDREYRTLPGRTQTAIAGSSMGGLVSLTMAIDHHDKFALCGILSPSLWWAKGSVLERAAASPRWLKRMRFWVCMGTREGGRAATRGRPGGVSSHIQRTRQLVALFDEARLVPGREYYYWEVAGGEHNEAAWAARFDKVLLFFFG